MMGLFSCAATGDDASSSGWVRGRRAVILTREHTMMLSNSKGATDTIHFAVQFHSKAVNKDNAC